MARQHTIFLPLFAMSPKRWAKACHLRPAVIYDAIRAGELSVSKFGRHSRISVLQMSEWFDAHTSVSDTKLAPVSDRFLDTEEAPNVD
jgi:hypothetical protein